MADAAKAVEVFNGLDVIPQAMLAVPHVLKPLYSSIMLFLAALYRSIVPAHIQRALLVLGTVHLPK